MTKKPDLIAWQRGGLWMCREDRAGSVICSFENFAALLKFTAQTASTARFL